MKYFFGLFLMMNSAVAFGQFNTLTYSAPMEKAKPQNIFEEKKTISAKSENAEKKSRKIFKIFGGTTKADLKKDIDSLKGLILKMEKSRKKQAITDSLVAKTQEKITKNNHYSVKKFDFVKEPQVISKISMPLNKMVITSPFGVRHHPIFGGQKMHNGIDLGANFENVFSVLDGVISEEGWDNKGGGNYIKIRHSDRFETIYRILRNICLI